MADELHMPDPTALTTQQLQREVSSLKELLETRIEALERATKVAHDDLVRVPTEVQKTVSALENLHNEKFLSVHTELASRTLLYLEKFESIQTQFKERDARTEQTTKDGKTAVDAALQAAKEAVGKSESTTVKQIDQLGVLINEKSRSLDDKITDAKERLTRIESIGIGVAKAETKQDTSNNFTLGVVGFVVGVIIAVIGFLIGR